MIINMINSDNYYLNNNHYDSEKEDSDSDNKKKYDNDNINKTYIKDNDEHRNDDNNKCNK